MPNIDMTRLAHAPIEYVPAEYERPFVEHWKLSVQYNVEIGNHLVSQCGIPKDCLILLLKPVNILTFEHIADFNRVIQVSDNLYSSSLDVTEYNNLLSHSCDPNSTLCIHSDHTIDFVSMRHIQPGEPISFDYNGTEWDMVHQGTDFKCKCGTAHCCGWVRGKKYIRVGDQDMRISSPDLGGEENIRSEIDIDDSIITQTHTPHKSTNEDTLILV